ncbi:MAG: Uma2 family endonuclease [Planctomycetota bacterium]
MAKAGGYTVADLEQLPEGWPAEIVDGVLVMTPSPAPYHQVLVMRLADAVRESLGPRDRDRCLAAPLDVVLDDRNVVQPDVMLLPRGARCTGPDWRIPRPVWAAEVLSPATECWDRGPKLDAYRAAGLSEVWLVDPHTHAIEIHAFPDAARRLGPGDHAATELLPGFALDVAALFAVR